MKIAFSKKGQYQLIDKMRSEEEIRREKNLTSNQMFSFNM